ncbi:MAG: hypothetical protein HC814_06795 [Rhodobacteraceae bacterium]|nr:hypothetical protein [Paracoccaceae bacterium]
MNNQAQLAPADAADLAGDLALLIERLGSTDGLIASGDTGWLLGCSRIESLESLRTFLDNYRAQMLEMREFPTILQAWRHASRAEARELIELDRRLAAEPSLQPFAQASLLAGRHQLRRLRPLRDERVVQRYLAALETGQANGWHTVVYGVTLAIYSLPPRQGLLEYARQTLNGFAQSAGRRLAIAEADWIAAAEKACAPLSAVVNELVDACSQSPFVGAETAAERSG